MLKIDCIVFLKMQVFIRIKTRITNISINNRISSKKDIKVNYVKRIN